MIRLRLPGPNPLSSWKIKSRRHACRRRSKLISDSHHGGTLRSKFMHKIAGLFLAVTLIGISSFSQSASPKPAVNPASKTTAHTAAASPQIPIPDIKYTKFVLKNGLTVLVHEDHKA